MPASPTPAQEAVAYQVRDMSCTSCVLRINATLRQQRGVSGVQIDLPTKTIQFRYRPEQVPLTTITEALAGAGYPVTALDAPAQ